MLYLRPEQGPRERLAIVDQSARRASRTPEVRAIASQVLRSSAGYDDAQRAALILAVACAPPYRGATETDGTKGQWIIVDVPYVLLRGGDCVERTHALIALALACGLDAMPVWLAEGPGTVLDHVVAMIYAGGAWQWADPLPPCSLLGTPPAGIATRLDR